MEVAEACSGLRSLVTLLALGAVVAEGTVLGSDGLRRWWSRWALFLFAVPVAVAVSEAWPTPLPCEAAGRPPPEHANDTRLRPRPRRQ